MQDLPDRPHLWVLLFDLRQAAVTMLYRIAFQKEGFGFLGGLGALLRIKGATMLLTHSTESQKGSATGAISL